MIFYNIIPMTSYAKVQKESDTWKSLRQCEDDTLDNMKEEKVEAAAYMDCVPLLETL